MPQKSEGILQGPGVSGLQTGRLYDQQVDLAGLNKINYAVGTPVEPNRVPQPEFAFQPYVIMLIFLYFVIDENFSIFSFHIFILGKGEKASFKNLLRFFILTRAFCWHSCFRVYFKTMGARLW